MARLDTALEQTRSTGGRAAVVVGAAGLGKSRLRNELLDHWRDHHPDVQVWAGGGDSRRYESSFGVLGPMLQTVMDVPGGAPRSERDQAVRRFFQEVGVTPTSRLAGLVVELIGGSEASLDGTGELHEARQDPRLLGDMMGQAWLMVVNAVLARGPLVIAIDDLHWCDRPTVSYLDAALAAAPNLPLLVLGFARPSLDNRYPELWSGRRVTRVELSKMGSDASSALVRAVLDDANDEEVARIVARARGNALLLEELVRAVARRREGSGERVTPTSTATRSPAELVQRRLDALAPNQRRALQAASVFGRRFWFAPVAEQLADLAPAELDAAIKGLVEAELVQGVATPHFSGTTEFAFRHDLICEAVYKSLSAHDRSAGHRIAAAWLSSAGESDATLLAEHWWRGDVPEHAAVALVRGSNRALAGHDFEQAVALANRGIPIATSPAQSANLFRLQAEAHRWLGQFTEAATAAHHAASATTRGTDTWLRAVEELLISLSRLGRFDDAHAWLSETTTIEPGRENAAQLVATLCAGARMEFQAGRYTEGDAILAQIRAHTMTHRDVMTLRALSEACRLRGARARHRGDVAGDFAGYRDALELLERLGDERNACNARVSAAFAYIELGAFELAEAELLRAHADAGRMRMSTVENRARQNLSLIAAARGELFEAQQLAHDVIETSLAEGNPRFEAWTRIYLSQFAHQTGAAELALEEAERAVAITESSPPARVGALGARARARLAVGDLTGSLVDAHAAKQAMVAHGGIEEFEALVRVSLVEALLASGQREAATAELVEARERLHGLAEEISDDALRSSFLDNVPLNALLLGLARDHIPS